jgi:hypothetical protein
MAQKKPISLAFAIPDHPWVDSADGAAVRVAMTIGVAGNVQGVLQKVIREVDSPNDEATGVTLSTQAGKLFEDLTTGADVASALVLIANEAVAGMGVKLHGMGFVVTEGEAKNLGLGRHTGLEQHIKPFINGRDLMQSYNHADCFNKFPFPASTPAQQEKIRALGEQLDAHRKRQQAAAPRLTMTGMYNVLERVREW